MHSWVFRHRSRLRVIYGMIDPEPAAALPEAELEVVVDLEYPEEAKVEQPAPSTAAPRKAPGTLVWRSRYVVLTPMAPPEF